MENRTSDIISLTATVLAISALFFSQLYVLGGLTIAAAIFSVGWIWYSRRKEEISYLSALNEIKILDQRGQLAKQTLTKTLIPKSKNVTLLSSRYISGTGTIKFVHANQGELYGPVVEGGLMMIYTIHKTPLPKGEPFTSSILFEASDCFLQDEESCIFHVNHKYKKNICMRILLPEGRAAKTFKGSVIYKGVERPHPLAHNSTESLLEIVGEKPRVGEVYKIQWEW